MFISPFLTLGSPPPSTQITFVLSPGSSSLKKAPTLTGALSQGPLEPAPNIPAHFVSKLKELLEPALQAPW